MAHLRWHTYDCPKDPHLGRRRGRGRGRGDLAVGWIAPKVFVLRPRSRVMEIVVIQNPIPFLRFRAKNRLRPLHVRRQVSSREFDSQTFAPRVSNPASTYIELRVEPSQIQPFPAEMYACKNAKPRGPE